MISFVLILIIIFDILRMVLFADEIDFIEIVLNCIVISIIIYAILVGWSLSL